MRNLRYEQLIMQKFYKHLDRQLFFVAVRKTITDGDIIVSIWSRPAPMRLLSRERYKSQQEALDKAEEVCMMVTFGVG
jgi:hypothetical protein